MITATANTAMAEAVLRNGAAYTEGFGVGAKDGLDILLTKIGVTAVEAAGIFMDKMAAANHLHHIYEWTQTGSAGGRLFDYDFVVSGNSVLFSGDLKVSSTIAPTSTEVFANKAFVMEEGQTVTISPQSAKALAFNVGSDPVFVTGSVNVSWPGVAGTFQRYSQVFFGTYLRQSFLLDIMKQLSTADEFVAGWAAGAKGGGFGAGRAAGVKYISSPKFGIGGGS
jgi:hypothetical protein